MSVSAGQVRERIEKEKEKRIKKRSDVKPTSKAPQLSRQIEATLERKFGADWRKHEALEEYVEKQKALEEN